ncbi:MAG: epimerase [Gemmatimonadota bacterium]
MNVLLYGATGMVGSGVLLECLDDERVESVLIVGRHAHGVTHAKVHQEVRKNVADLAGLEDRLARCDACFFCLGVSAAGLDEARYSRLTFDLTVKVAEQLAAVRPDATFCYVSGAGTDGSEKGRFMWARVKGRTENRLLEMFPNAFMFRPGYIQPKRGVRSRTRLYRALYAIAAPLYPILRRLGPRLMTTTVDVGRAMIEAAAGGYPERILEVADINALAQRT